jgi:LDH2 family malate/lactate/ureidoglycolate dehydrogenase
MEHAYSVERLRKVIMDIIAAVGLEPSMAKVFADSIVAADLRGVKSHGTIRVPEYVRRVESGVMDPRAEARFVRDEGAVGLLDAGNGFGQAAAYKAMRRAIEKATAHGVGLVGVRNSNHFGIASYYAMTALEAGMIGVVMTNASPAINPFGTITPLLGTNPIAVAVPAGTEKPIVLDMSTSLVARGKIRFAALTGKEIPLGWATDANGEPTTDAQKALKGSLEPIGGVKGSGLSLLVDILCGILTNSCLTGEVKTIVDISGPAKTGHIFGAIDIAHFIGLDLFKNNVDAVIQHIKSLPSKGGQEIFLPGEIEFNLAEKRVKEGIPLEDAVVQNLNALGARYHAGRLEE